MNLVFYPANVFDEATLAVTSERDDGPKENLADRDVLNPWIAEDTSAQELTGDKVGNALTPDTLILPGGHGLAGLALVVRSAPDGSSWTSRKTYTPSTDAAVAVALTSTTLVAWWQLQIASGGAAADLAELYLSLGVSTAKVPSQQGTQLAPITGVSRGETRGGQSYLSQRQTPRWRMTYTWTRISEADRLILDGLWTLARPFYLADHTGALRWVTLVSEPDYAREFGAADVWTAAATFLEAQPVPLEG
jgi:hypothetical protein